MLDRPTYLENRQIQGRAFSEPLTIRRTQVTRNAYGEHDEEFAVIQTLCATHPVNRLREKMQGGVELEEDRVFYTVEELHPVVESSSAGDIVVYKNETYRINSTQNWGTYSESLGKRQEGQ